MCPFCQNQLILLHFMWIWRSNCANILTGHIHILRLSLHTDYQTLFWPEISYVSGRFQIFVLKKYYCSYTKTEIWLPSNFSWFASATIPIPLVSSCSTKRHLKSEGHHSLPCNLCPAKCWRIQFGICTSCRTFLFFFCLLKFFLW